MNPSADCFNIEHASTHLHIAFKEPRRVLSSAPLNGGLLEARHILNLNVEKNRDGAKGRFDPPEVTLSDFCWKMGWQGPVVGMMTGAGMNTFRKVRCVEQGVEVIALVTAGISNARRAGEPAECREFGDASAEIGTINIIILTNAHLTQAAMVEAVMMVTEAKAAAFQDLKIRNPQNGFPATGTGTDAVAVVSGCGPVRVRFCGKHMLYGEMLASTVMEAITSSLDPK